MSTLLDQITAKALQLSPEDRAELIERLVASPLPVPALHPDWGPELARRTAAFDAGHMEFIPSDQALAELEAHLLAPRP